MSFFNTTGSWPHQLRRTLCSEPRTCRGLHSTTARESMSAAPPSTYNPHPRACDPRCLLTPLPFHVAAVSSAIEVSCEERVHYLLQLSAMLAVLCQSSTGLPLNAIRLGLWLFAFFFFNYSEGCFLKHAISTSRFPPALGLQAAAAASQRTHKHTCRWCKKIIIIIKYGERQEDTQSETHAHPRPVFGSCFPHNMC